MGFYLIYELAHAFLPHHSHLSLAPLPTLGFQASKVPNPFLAQGLHTVSSLDLECSSPGLRFHLSHLKMFSMILLMILIYTDMPKCIHHIFFNWIWNSNPAWTPSLGPWRLVALSSEHCGLVLWERGVRGWGLGLDEPPLRPTKNKSLIPQNIQLSLVSAQLAALPDSQCLFSHLCFLEKTFW